MLRIKRVCATRDCGKRTSSRCVRCGAYCCRRHGKMYHVAVDDFPAAVPVHRQEELQSYGARVAELVLCPLCLRLVTAEHNGQDGSS